MTETNGRRPWSAMPPGTALLTSPVRRAVVEELASLEGEERSTGLTAHELGDRLELHATTIRFHVDQLVSAGVLESHFVRSGGVGRPSKCYYLHESAPGQAQPQTEGHPPFDLLAGVLASALSVQDGDRTTPEEAGVRWARRQTAGTPPHPRGTPEETVEGVVGLLGEWGYRPEVQGEEGGAVDVLLQDCPFLDLAQNHPDVVCGMHRGLLRGALDSMGESDAHVTLRPFVTPTTCTAHIRLAQPTPTDQETS